MQNQEKTIPIDSALMPPPTPQPSATPSVTTSTASFSRVLLRQPSPHSQSISDWGSTSDDVEQQDRKIKYLEAKSDRYGAILKRLASQQGLDIEGEIDPPQTKKRSRASDDRFLTSAKKKELTKVQRDVRSEILKLLNKTLRMLAGTKEDSHLPPADLAPGEHRNDKNGIVLIPDFTREVTYGINSRLVTQATTLVYRDQADAIRKDIRFKDVLFTEQDVLEIAKAAFRNWKESYKLATDENAKDKAKAEKKRAAQTQRKRQKKQDRIEMQDEYLLHYSADVGDVLDTDWTSDYVSELDNTEDESERAFHRGRMVSAAGLQGSGQGEIIWERVRPAFRSEEINLVYSHLVELLEERDASSGKKKVGARRVDLGRTHNRVPAKPPYPFMVNETWRQKFVDGKHLDPPFRMKREDPEGFGKKKGITEEIQNDRLLMETNSV
ncbi:hypothetical protein ACEPAF_7126 [Sanghuangporus sanghuang]